MRLPVHHAPSGPPLPARIAASVVRWGLRVRAAPARLAVLVTFVHRSRVLPVTLAALVMAGLAVVVPVVSSAEPEQGDVALSSTAGGRVGDLVEPVPGGDWVTDGEPDVGTPPPPRPDASAQAGPSAGSATGSAEAPTGPPPASASGPATAGSDDAGTAPGTPATTRTGASGETTTPSSTAPSSTAPSSTAPSSTAPSSTAPSSTAPSSTAPSSTGQPASSAPPSTSAETSPGGALEEQVLALVNDRRAAAGCAAVTADGGLAAVARAHSADMRDRDFFDHVNPDGLDPFDRAERAGLSHARAENIARGQEDAAAVMASWMDRAGHRATILDCELRTLGVGVATGSGGPWWTQLFGS